MRKIKNILLAFLLSSISICGFSQNHIIDDPANPKEKSGISTNNYKIKRTGLRFSMDSINVSPNDIINGDSILMLKYKPALLTNITIVYRSVSSPYSTGGSSDTTKIMSKTDVGNKAVAMISDDLFEETKSGFNSVPISSSCMSDSSLYWLSIPSSKYSGGDGYFTLYYSYTILD